MIRIFIGPKTLPFSTPANTSYFYSVCELQVFGVWLRICGKLGKILEVDTKCEAVIHKVLWALPFTS